MLADSHVVPVRKLVLPSQREVGPVGGPEIANAERAARGITRKGCVATAHERVAREDHIARLPPDHRLVLAQVEDVSRNAFDGSLTQTSIAWQRRRPENPCSALRCRAEATFCVAHQLEP